MRERPLSQRGHESEEEEDGSRVSDATRASIQAFNLHPLFLPVPDCIFSLTSSVRIKSALISPHILSGDMFSGLTGHGENIGLGVHSA